MGCSKVAATYPTKRGSQRDETRKKNSTGQMAISAAGREKEMKLQGKWKEEMRPYGTKK